MRHRREQPVEPHVAQALIDEAEGAPFPALEPSRYFMHMI